MGLRGICLVAAALVAAGPAGAQNAAQQAEIDATLTERVATVQGTALDKTKAGYYRLRLQPAGINNPANVCPTSDADRDRLKDIAKGFYAWALKKKRDWGATAQIVYSRGETEFSADGFKPDLQRSFFTVTQDGASAAKCQLAASNISAVFGPLIAFDSIPNNAVQIQFGLWDSTKVDRARIASLLKGASSALGIFGVPIGLLDKVREPATNEIKTLLDSQSNRPMKVTLYATDADLVSAVARLGLREPEPATAATEARVTATLEPISSMFSPDAPSYVTLATKSPATILEHPIQQPTATPSVVLLQNYLGTYSEYSAMLNADSYPLLSAACDGMFLKLRDELRFSAVDSMVILRAIIQKKAPKGSPLSDLTQIQCLTGRAALLGLVEIKLEAPPPPPMTTRIATDPEMVAAMNRFAQLRFTEAAYATDDQYDIFAFPLTVTDPDNRFGWSGGMRSFAATDRAALKELLEKQIEKIGCWVEFSTPPMTFALGLAPGGADAAKFARSAALVRAAGAAPGFLQFRFAPIPTNDGKPRIDGMAFSARDEQARAQMAGRGNCNAEWEKPALTAPAP